MKKARGDVVQQHGWRQQPPSSMSSMPPMPPQAQSPFTNTAGWYSAPHQYQPDMTRRSDGMDFRYAQHTQAQAGPQQHHPAPVQPPMAVPQQPQGAPQPGPPPQQQTPTPAPAPTPRQRKRPAPSAAPPQVVPPVTSVPATAPAMPTAPPPNAAPVAAPTPVKAAPLSDDANSTPNAPPAKKSRTNTPWTPAEELRLKQMRDAGASWAEIAKTFPTRTEGSVKKHWYKDMHYAEFAEDESQALLNAIKEYENNKWKTIGQKVGKPAKACEQYAKEHFPELFSTPKQR